MKRNLVLALTLAVGVTTFGGSLSAFADSLLNNSDTLNLEEMVEVEATLSNKSVLSKSSTQETKAEKELKFILEGESTKYSFPGGLVSTQDGSIVRAYNKAGDIFIEKADVNLNTIWSKKLTGSYPDGVNSICEDTDGTLLLVGYSLSIDGVFSPSMFEDDKSDSGYKDAFIIRLDADGNFMKGFRLLFSDDDKDKIFTTIKVAKNGDYILGGVGGNKYGETSLSDTFVYRLNRDFEVVWSYATKDTTNLSKFSYNAGMKEGDIIEMSSGAIGFLSPTNRVILLDSQGRLINKISLSTLNCIFEASNGNLLIGGYGGYPTGIEFREYDSSGMFIGIVKSGEADVRINPLKLIKANDGYYVVGDSALYGVSNVDILMQKYDLDLNFVETLKWGGDGTDSGSRILKANDDIFILGTTKSTDLGTQLKGYTDSVLIKYGTEKPDSEAPGIETLEDGRIQLVDNNTEESKKGLYYRYIYSNGIVTYSDWVKYTAPFVPNYDSTGNYKIEVKSVNIYGRQSEIVSHSDFNPDYAETDNTSNITVKFNLEDALAVRYEENVVDFGDTLGLVEVESKTPVALVVDSTKTWDMTLEALTDFMGNGTGNTIEANKLSVKLGSEEYKQLQRKTEVKVLENQEAGQNLNHNLTFKLSKTAGEKPDEYKLVTRVKVTQK